MSLADAGPRSGTIYEFLEFRLDPRARTLSRNGAMLATTPKVFDTLLLLVRHAGQVVSKDQALAAIWPDTVVEESNLSQNIFLLRKLLGEQAPGHKIILTRAGVGYSFLPGVRELPTAPAETRKGMKLRWLWGAGIFLAAAAIAVLSFNSGLHLAHHGQPGPVRKWAVSTRVGIESFPALSRDGTRLAFTWDEGRPFGRAALFVQDIPAEGATLGPLRRLMDTNQEGTVICPAWSADGTQIAYVLQGPDRAGAYVVRPDGTGGRRVRDLQPITTAYTGCPVGFSPDGRALALAIGGPDTRSQLIRHVLDSRADEPLMPAPSGANAGDWNPVYSPDGRYLAFARRELRGSMNVFVVPAAADGHVAGEPRQLTHDSVPLHGMTWTPDSHAVVYSATRLGTDAIWRVPLSGGVSEPVPGGDQGTFPSMAKNGRLSYAMQSENRNLWRMELAPNGTPAGAPTLLLSSTRRDEGPVYSRDGARLSFFSDRTGSYEIWACDSDGGNPRALTAFGGAFAGLTNWSPDRRTLLFDVVMPGSNQDVWAVPAEGGKAWSVVADAARDATPSFSRDGRSIYFGSDRSGRFQIWRANADGTGAMQVTQRGGLRPLEGDDGFIYYASRVAAPEIRRVPVRGGPEETVVARPQVGFFGHWALAGSRIYSIHQPDGSLYDGPRRSELWVHELDSQRSRKVAELPTGIDHTTPSLAVSPDGKWVVFSKLDAAASDLYMVDQVR